MAEQYSWDSFELELRAEEARADRGEPRYVATRAPRNMVSRWLKCGCVTRNYGLPECRDERCDEHRTDTGDSTNGHDELPG